jgi:hypothetical protein
MTETRKTFRWLPPWKAVLGAAFGRFEFAFVTLTDCIASNSSLGKIWTPANRVNNWEVL